MRLEINVLLDYEIPEPADMLLAVEAAQLPDQLLVEDRLTIDGAGPLRPVDGEDGIGRRTWMQAQGPFRAIYRAVVDVVREAAPIQAMPILPRRELPAEVVPYLWPSRYCEADRFEEFVGREFGSLAGGAKIVAMADWIYNNLHYRPGSSDATTTAADAFVGRAGVCRDFAHLMATFARAAGVPARLVAAYAWRLDPPDFHAIVEVWLDGGWRLVDATRLAPVEGLVRIGIGRDATDIAFMTVFGEAVMNEQRVEVRRLD